MNIALITDENYVVPSGTALASVLQSNPDELIDFYIITAYLSDKSVSILQSFIAPHKERATLKIITLDKNIIADFPMRKGDHVSVATYYRIYFPSIMPLDVNKLLFIDGDILCIDTLREFYDFDVSNYSCMAAHDERNDDSKSFERLRYSQSDGYFNAGVMLINLSWWRTHNVQQQCLDYIAAEPDACLWHDQDALNHVLHGTVLWADFRYNFTQGFYFDKSGMCIDEQYYADIDRARKHPCILHFSSAYKPWHIECNHPLKKQYRDFYKQCAGKPLALSHKLHGIPLFKWQIKKLLHTLHIKRYADFRKPIE